MVYELQDDEFMIPLDSSFADEKNGHDQDGWTEPKQHDSRKKAAFWHANLPIVLFHVLLTCTYSFVAIAFVSYARASCRLAPACPDRLTYSPAYEIVTWHVRTIDSSKLLPSPFSGNPGPEVDGAWENLINRINIRISQDDVDQLNRTSIQIANGSGDYWGSFEVSTGLVIIVNRESSRHYIAKDFYPDVQGLEVKSGQVYPEDIEHCIETLRTHLMCQPDLNLYTYGWRSSQCDPHANDFVEHTCINWNSFEAWIDERRFSERDPRGFLIRPDGTFLVPKYALMSP